ncbi:MAG: RNA 2',3'-cyclic phosphodiesterase [Gammaproteobacteria bacterium]|nr:RNA 2',3'-cyclic phosphodiesterase [Gammaproteobacteria bacterium]
MIPARDEPRAPADDGSRRRERLFFALWPDAACRAALAALARERLPRKRGRAVADENLHLTLAFLGAVDGGFRACAEDAAASVSVAPFVLSFERSGYWPRSRVLWSAPAETPPALHRLASALSRALLPCGYEPERRAFSGHVTLARKVQGPIETLPHAPIAWAVREFHLVRSETRSEGASYEVVATWALGEVPAA